MLPILVEDHFGIEIGLATKITKLPAYGLSSDQCHTGAGRAATGRKCAGSTAFGHYGAFCVIARSTLHGRQNKIASVFL
jgi:hypothetical protein